MKRPGLPARARLPAGVTALAVVVATACGSSTTTGGPATGPTTSAASTACVRFGSTSDASGASAVTRTPAVALLGNVQVQASACVDEVSFLFMGGLPGWSVGYRDGPLTEDPSGLPAQVLGTAHLIVRFEPATGVDLSQQQTVVTYDGPTVMSPPAPSGLAQLRRLGDFESVTSWAIGLAERRPFAVITRGDQLAIRVAATTPRSTRCSLPAVAVSVGFPAGWYAELSDRWACRYFDGTPFPVHPATDDISWAVTVEPADASATEIVARMTAGGAGVVAHPARLGKLAATVLDITSTGQGLHPAGWRYRMYVVDTGPRALTISSAAHPPGPQAEADRRAADRIAELLLPA